MKLVHLTTVPMTLRFLVGQVGYMKDQGFEVNVVSSPGRELDEFGASEQVTTHAVAMTRAISPSKDLISLTRLVALFREQRPDIVHAHTPKAGLLGILAAWITGVPCRIFHLHGLPHSTAKGLARNALIWSTKIPCVLATRVLCVSKSAAATTCLEGLCRRDRIHVVGTGSANGVDAGGQFNPGQYSREATRRPLGFKDHDLILGFVGRLVRDKGICELYQAWKVIREEFPNAYLLIAGELEERDGVPPEIVSALRADARVRALGFVKETAPLYAAFDVLVLPTYREGLPTVLLEAAAMAVPVVATRSVGCVDAVVEEITGLLVDVGDHLALTDALRRYLSNPDLRWQHGRHARERVVRDFRPEDVWKATHAEYAAALAERSGNWFSSAAKRFLDIAVSLAAIVFAGPLLLMAAILVRLRLGSPVLFRQTRPGLNERPFKLIKFRTMRDAFDADGRPLPDNDRLTPLGRFLRCTSLDELPELWNVLKGDMSLVGPRPLLMQYLPRYTAAQHRRHDVKPGLTGWAQVNGRNALAWEQKFELVVWYVDNQSFWLDLRILAITIYRVIRKDGISQQGHATMPEFFGPSTSTSSEIT